MKVKFGKFKVIKTENGKWKQKTENKVEIEEK